MTSFDRLFMYIMTLCLVREECAVVKQCAKRVVRPRTVSIAGLTLASSLSCGARSVCGRMIARLLKVDADAGAYPCRRCQLR